ncbi:hypothetical protein C8T65DRAFT_743844 [Cerioporus squamosus]|nr:hypothetical protein C8T65DRAFT_743844 [Cerioporus squamosus]
MFKSFFALASLLAVVAAGPLVIKDPAPSTTVHAGQRTVVALDVTPGLGGVDEVAIVIGIQSCNGHAPSGSCDGIDPTHNIGHVIFKGPFDPQVQAGSGRTDQLQSVTVEIPANFPKGAALITVAHFGLNIGVNPFIETVHNTVIVN